MTATNETAKTSKLTGRQRFIRAAIIIECIFGTFIFASALLSGNVALAVAVVAAGVVIAYGHNLLAE